MDITKIDKNFANSEITRNDLEWHQINEDAFELTGVYYSEKDKQYLRLPKEIADNVNEGVAGLCTHTSGGRLRFRTNSPFFALRVEQRYVGVMTNMTLMGSAGFSLYVNGEFVKCFAPLLNTSLYAKKAQEPVFYEGLFENFPKYLNQTLDCELFFPLYYNVHNVYIGLQKDCELLPPKPLTHPEQIIFYGSSITQGGCATQPGNGYSNILARMLDAKVLNLGFSGSCRGEQLMAEYISSLPHSVFVLDYDHNAPTLEHLKNTHYAFYKKYREVCKDTPIIFITKPDYNKNPKICDKHRRVVKQTYLKALAEGDKNVYYVDGRTLMGKDYFYCFVDTTHPNDFGFYKMAKRLYPILNKLLNKEN